jgi:predicted Zn-dependent protease
MKRTIFFVLLVLAAAAALYYSQKQEQPAPASANAIVNLAAETQHDLSRLPMRVFRISEADEIRIGDQLAKRYEVPDAKLSPEARAEQQYIRRVGGRLLPYARRRLAWRFHLIPDHDLVNAFALPGGHVFVGEGLLDLMLHEDELANVLAHEIEHADLGHCVERYEVEAKARKLHLGALGELAQLPLSLWQTGYQKDEESEADRQGLYLAVSGGYSPYGAITLMEKMGVLQHEHHATARTPGQELSRLALESLAGYFRTHPQSSERLVLFRSIIAQEHWEDRQEQKQFKFEY